MRKGGGKPKGNEWERETGRRLSMWLTNGQRRNVFARNVLSGGGFTITHGKGQETPNIPGDLMAASPLAFDFLSTFSVECKDTQEIDLVAFINDHYSKKSFMMRTILHTEKQAKVHGLTWIIVGKRNFQKPFVIMDYPIAGVEAVKCVAIPAAFHWHLLHNSRYMMCSLHHLVTLVNAQRFINGVKVALVEGR